MFKTIRHICSAISTVFRTVDAAAGIAEDWVVTQRAINTVQRQQELKQLGITAEAISTARTDMSGILMQPSQTQQATEE